jgi:hypothetical protein
MLGYARTGFGSHLEVTQDMSMKRVTRLGLALLALTVILSAQTKHPLKLDDIARFREVRDPNLSPDGKQVAYVVSTIDTKEDKSTSHIWIVTMDGKSDRQMTFRPGKREFAPLESGRQVPLVHFLESGSGKGKSGLVARPKWR